MIRSVAFDATSTCPAAPSNVLHAMPSRPSIDESPDPASPFGPAGPAGPGAPGAPGSPFGPWMSQLEVCLGLLAGGVVEDDADEPVPDVTAGVDRVRATRRGG